MNAATDQPGSLNILFAWIWFLAGTASGMGLGLFFQEDGWLGGYTSLRRRLYRLGHISFFGLGLINLLYGFTMILLRLPGDRLTGNLFVLSGITMPLTCVCLAHWRGAHPFFALPVGALMTAILLTLARIL